MTRSFHNIERSGFRPGEYVGWDRFDGSFAAWSVFAVDSSCRVRGRYIHGYATSSESGLRFIAHSVCKSRFWLNGAKR